MNKRPSAFIFLFCMLGALFGFYNQYTIIFYSIALFACIISILVIKLSVIRTILFLCFCFLLSSINSKIYKQNYFEKITNVQKQKYIIYNGLIKNIKIKEDASKTALVNAYEQKNPNNSLNLIINFYDSASALDLKAGDLIKFKAKFNPLSQSLSVVHFNGIKYGLANNIHGKIAIKDSALIHKITTQKTSLSIKFQENLRINLLKYLTIKEASLLLALMIGDTSLLDQEQTEIFNAIGAQHLLAVSGLQVSLLSFFLYLLLSWLLALVFPIKFLHRSKPIASVICLCFIWFFVAICGFPRSAARAAFMSSILLLPNLFIRKIDIFDAFYASGFISLLLNPACVLDLGFLLSYAAVFGLIVANQSSKKLLEPLKEYSFVLFYSISLFSSCLAAYLATLPILAICFGQTSVLSILSNFFLLQVATLCQSIAILLGFLGNIFSSSILLHLASFLALSIEIVAEFLSNYFSLSIFFPITNNFILFIFCFLLFLIFTYLLQQKFKFSCALILASMLCASSFYWPQQNSLLVSILAVGQGDSTLIQTPSGHTILIDAAGAPKSNFDPGKYIITPLLKRKGVNKLDVLAITHPDADHILGSFAIMDNFKINEIWLGSKTIKNDNLEAFLKKALSKNIPIKSINNILGENKFGDTILEVLAPKEYDHKLSINNNSLVIKISFANKTLLWPGDIEDEAEEKLLLSQANIKADILKAPHHGSKTSSTKEFIEAVMPNIVIFSTGLNNRFGFPHKEVLERYSEKQVKIFDTAQDGEIIIEISKENFSVNTFKQSYQNKLLSIEY